MPSYLGGSRGYMANDMRRRLIEKDYMEREEGNVYSYLA